MRRVLLLSVVCLTAGLTSGCDLKEVYPTAAVPTGGVRFINAVPDSAGAFGMDLRFVDQLESNVHFRHNFRSGPAVSATVTGSGAVQYKAVRAGSRQFRIFLDDTLQNIATIVMKDTTVVIEAGRNYTALLMGSARTPGSMRLAFFEETVADPGTAVAVRVINTTPNALDVRQYPNGGAAPGPATWASVAPFSISSHVTIVTPVQTRYNVVPAGGAVSVFNSAFGAVTDPLTLIGAPASSTAGALGRLDIEALPGTTIPGSATTLIVFPPSQFNNAGVSKFTVTTAGNTNRVAGSVALVGAAWRVTDCFGTVGCLIPGFPPTAPTTPGWVAAAFNPTSYGYYVVVVRAPAGTGIAPVTVLVTTNGTNFMETSTSLAAFVGPFAQGPVRYDVVGYITGMSSVFDRRPPYIP